MSLGANTGTVDSLPAGFEPVAPPAAPTAPASPAAPPQGMPAGFEPVPAHELRPINPAPPSFLDRVASGQRVMESLQSVWKSTKEGFGDQPIGSTQNKDLAGAMAVSVPIRRAVEAYDLLTRTINAGIYGTADVAAQAVGAAGGSQGWQERAREDVQNFGSWLMSEGGMRSVTKGEAHAPLIDAGDGNLARVTRGPDGKPATEIVGKFPPTHDDFANAAQAIASKAEPSGSTIEQPKVQTRGKGVQYHGSSDPDLKPSDTHYSTGNYYGQGFYTTDAADVAFGYSKRGARDTGARDVYRVDENQPVKIFDMERPMPEKLLEAIRPAAETDDLLAGALDEHPKNLRELYNAIREQSASDRVPADEVQGIFDTINYHLQQMGYGGMSHTGGLNTKTEPHHVTIYFNPESDLSLTKVAHGSIESKLSDLWQNQGIHPVEAAADAKNDAFLAHDLGSAATHPTDIPPLVSTAVQPLSVPGKIVADLRRLKDKAFDVGRWVQEQIAPISTAPDPAVRYMTEMLSSNRRIAWDWLRIDKDLADKFTPEQRIAMGRALDEESVMAQSGEKSEHMGLSTLAPEEQAAVKELMAHSIATRMQMLDRGMVTDEGLPFYMPRVFSGIQRGEPIDLGPAYRIRESTGTMRQRKYLTAEESEAAAKARFGDKARLEHDIRVLPAVLAKQQKAIAAHDFIEGVRKFGLDSGDPQILEGAIPKGEEANWITVPESDLFKWRMIPAPESGLDKLIKEPLHVKADWAPAFKALADTKFNNWDKVITEIKNRPLTLIMNSPFIHDSVVYSKALPSNPGNLLTFRFMRQGEQLRSDPKFSSEMLDAGLVPWGKRAGFKQDVTGEMEGPQFQPGRSITSRLLGYVPDLFSKDAGNAVKSAVDRAGEFWHDKLLGEQVQKLQFSLAYDFRETLRKKFPEIPDDVLNVLAAHEGNRFGGSLPPEAMSAFSRGVTNTMFFSRQFTFGNLGILKDAAKGPPEYVMGRIRDMLGPEGADQATALKNDMRRHAFAVVALDIAMYYGANALLQSTVNVASGTPMSDEAAGYWWRLKQAANRVVDAPASPSSYLSFLPSMSPTFYHEPGKEGKIMLGLREDGTAIYARSVIGRMGEDYTGLLVNPALFALNKMAPLPRAFMEVLNDKDEFGRPIYDPKALKSGDLTQAWNIAKHFIEAELPMQQVQAVGNTWNGHADYKDAINFFGPYMPPPVTVTGSQGYPGGPTAGVVAGHQRDQRTAQDLAMSGIKDMVQKQNDIGAARQKMDELGVNRGLQNALIRTWQHPGMSKTSPRALSEFYQHATPVEKEVLDYMLNGGR